MLSSTPTPPPTANVPGGQVADAPPTIVDDVSGGVGAGAAGTLPAWLT